MYQCFGPQHWWPGETQIEIMVGAVLTQNTNWRNVESAILQLKQDQQLSFRKLIDISPEKLAELIKPSGFFRLKAQRLKNLLHFIEREYQGQFKKMQAQPLGDLRNQLLTVKGIGLETADSILLYAFGKPTFVIDAYTRRFMSRHQMVPADIAYAPLQKIFLSHLNPDVQTFNEYHALIVQLGKSYCRSKPLCEGCPLAPML